MKGWKKGLIKIALRILDKHVIQRIKYEPLREYVAAQLSKLERIIEILTDKDPDNKTQFAEFWQTQRDSVFRDTIEAAAEIIVSEVKDKEDAALYSSILLSLMEDHLGEEEIMVS